MKRRTRMYEPWGYQDENNYQGAETILENDLESFFADAKYNKDDNKIHFNNKDGEEVGSLDVNEFVKSDSIIDHTEYADGILKVFFTNGDVVTIDLTELLDENEFKDGLVVDGHVVKVLIDGDSDSKYVSVSESGVKVAGIEADIEAEKTRAEGEEQRIEAKLDEEISRAISAETVLDAKIDQEIADRIAEVDEEETRATGEEQRIEAKLDDETTRAKNIEQALNSELDAEEVAREAGDAALGVRIDNEINERKADVDEEEARAKAAEEALQGAIDDEVTRATSAETALQEAIASEGQRAQDAEAALDAKIDAETTRAEEVEAALDEKIDTEEERAVSAETTIINAINELDEVKADKANAVASAEYVSADTKIYFKDIDGNTISEIDASDFIKDGMIDDVKIEGGDLVIVFNTDAGKERIEIPLTDIFNPDNYYDKTEVDGFVSALTASDEVILDAVDNVSAEVENEAQRALSAETDLQAAIDLKADKETTYTQEEVDALLLAKENEIYNLTKIVGDMGGAVTYDLPSPAGKSFNTLMNNNGTVKLTDDVTTGRFGPGITAKNTVKLNLNNNDLTITGLTITTAQAAIMARGTQNITIYGKGTIDASNGICIEGNGADSVINLTGSTTVYQTDRSGGELIYCYAGTINITNGIFKNNGEDKKFLLNCYDANYRAGTAKIIVTGGKFYDFNPADNSAEGEHTSFVPEGYHVEISQDGDSTVYTVKKDA